MPEIQELRYDDSLITADRYHAMIQPEEDGYQQDQDQDSLENELKDDHISDDIEVCSSNHHIYLSSNT